MDNHNDNSTYVNMNKNETNIHTDLKNTTTTEKNTYHFQAEINQLLSLIINTFYTKKDIFLRELISNSSDALDKARYFNSKGKINQLPASTGCLQQADRQPFGQADRQPFGQAYDVRLSVIRDDKILRIEDTGIGMTRAELMENMGTIAHSGTKKFMESKLVGSGSTSCADALIGQFGVGFYSAYLVADVVTVTSAVSNSTMAHVWESSANGTFTIDAVPKASIWTSEQEKADNTLSGTRIDLHLKDDCLEYMETNKLHTLVQTYSQFINYPIYLKVERTREVEVENNDEDKVNDNDIGVTKETNADSKDSTDSTDSTDDATKPNTEVETYMDWELQNEQKPLWVRPSSEVTDEEYASLYKSLTNDWDSPLSWRHISAEGSIDFKGILYVPKKAPFDLYDSNKKHSIKLYVKRVFVMDEMDELIPEWLKFLRGVVDSDDLPLNISRELLQKNKVVKMIEKNLVKNCIEMFSEMARDSPDDYKLFYENYSKCLKLGVHDESKHKEKLLKLLRYTTNLTIGEKTDTKVSLDEYVGRMKPNQKGIYFITGETERIIHESPFLESLKENGTEILYMSDPIDEYVMQTLKEYGGHKLISCTRKNMDMEKDVSESKKGEQDDAEDSKNKGDNGLSKEDSTRLCERIGEVLGCLVEKVEVSTRMVRSPACLVSSEFGWSANMERIMRAQTLRDNSRTEFMTAKKMMEVNPKHRIIKDLAKRVNDGKDTELVKDVINLLYESSVIDSGFTLDTPKRFVRRINNMIALGLSLDEEDEEALREGDGILEVDVPQVKIEKMGNFTEELKDTVTIGESELTRMLEDEMMTKGTHEMEELD